MYLVYNKQVKDVCLRSKGIQAMAEQDRENCEARADMEEKKGKYKWLIILAACAAAAVLVTGVCLYWGERDASRGKQHEMKEAENETEISEGAEQKWTEDEIAAVERTLKKRYGDELERVSVETEDAGAGMEEKITVVTFRLPDIRTAGNSFYFQVKSSSESFDNFPFQLMKNDAWRFFKGKGRFFGLYGPDDGAMYDADSERWDTERYPGETDQLFVRCYREDDIGTCAADIADWLCYAAEDERYFLQNGMTEGKESDPFRNIWIITFKSHYRMNIGEAVDKLTTASWEEVQRAVARAIVKLDGEYHIWEMEDSAAIEGEESADNAFSEEKFFERYQGDYEKECELSDGRIRYRMVVMDAAAGSRWYCLLKSEDRGLSWDMVSDSPFGGDLGMGIDFTFLDEELGFATLTHNGGKEADLYITENGGESYQRVAIQGLEVALDYEGCLYNPYDFPQMPYEEDGKLYVLCGQGNDGDYDGGDAAGMALYESTDGGHTFTYKEIRKGEGK